MGPIGRDPKGSMGTKGVRWSAESKTAGRPGRPPDSVRSTPPVPDRQPEHPRQLTTERGRRGQRGERLGHGRPVTARPPATGTARGQAVRRAGRVGHARVVAAVDVLAADRERRGLRTKSGEGGHPARAARASGRRVLDSAPSREPPWSDGALWSLGPPVHGALFLVLGTPLVPWSPLVPWTPLIADRVAVRRRGRIAVADGQRLGGRPVTVGGLRVAKVPAVPGGF